MESKYWIPKLVCMLKFIRVHIFAPNERISNRFRRDPLIFFFNFHFFNVYNYHLLQFNFNF